MRGWGQRENTGSAWEKLLLWRAQSVRVITHRAEENQEGTLCGPDKQAVCLGKQCTRGLQPSRPAVQPTSPALLQAPELHAVISTLWNLPTCLGSAGPGNKRKSWRERGAEAERLPWMSATFFSAGEKAWLHNKTGAGLWRPGAAADQPAPPDHEVCSPHGSSGEWFVWTPWALS